MNENNKFKNMTLEKLARMVAEGFGEVENRFDRLETRITALEDRLTIIEGRLTNLELRMDRLFDEILGIKAELKHVVTHDDLKKLDVRVTALERAVGVAK